MGRGGVGYHSSRAEFLTDGILNEDLKYSRNGGCFVTTKKAIAFVVLAVLSILIIVVLMYFYGPNRKLETLLVQSNDIEKLINETLNKKVPLEELRLPKSVRPIHYRLWIHPILDENSDQNFTFTGQVKILINCTKKTNKIILHYDDLNISESDITLYTTKIITVTPDSNNTVNSTEEEREEISRTKRETEIGSAITPDPDLLQNLTIIEESGSNGTSPETVYIIDNGNDTFMNGTEFVTEKAEVVTEIVPVQEVIPWIIYDIKKDPENFRLIITTRNLLEVGHTYTVDIKFSGEILNNLKGLYKTSYKDRSGTTKWLATTHFQSIYARRVFPCFDEPFFKATFEISLARRTNMTALSNMPLKETEPMNGTDEWVWDHFFKTPPMSTYIVAFTISDFESIGGNSSRTAGPIIKVWAPKDDLPKTPYALSVAEEIIPFFESYFGIKFPLPKLDLVAVPNFGKPAMENWGIISFRKAALLFDEHSRSIKTKSLIFNKIAHELAHQWFGNLVTMDWWSDLWLNEGFGTFLAEIVLTNLRTRWLVYSSIQLRDTYKTLYFDSLKSAQSIQTEINSNEQIEQIFDPIIYQKGASILRMLNHAITKKLFRRGLQNYLKKYSYSTTTQDDLWKIFTSTARNQSILPNNITIKQLMNSWSTQKGYPLVTVTRNYSSEIAILNQTKMSEDQEPSEVLWYIPIQYLTSDEPNNTKSIWLENQRSIDLNLTSSNNDSWVLLNIDESGFYRVNYDLKNWQLLANQLQEDPEKIPVNNRGQLMDDAFHLSNLGVLNYSIAFDLTKYLSSKETNYLPWYSALRNLEELRVIITNYEYSGLYDEFMLSLIAPMYQQLGNRDKAYDLQNEKLLRFHLVTTACNLRLKHCIDWARSQFYNWMNTTDPDLHNPIPVDYRYIAQCMAIRNGGIEEWDFLWNRTFSPTVAPVDLQTAYLSLGCTNDPWLINRYLEYSLSGNMSLENVANVWMSINHPVGVQMGFKFLRLNWDRIYQTYEDVYLVFSTIFHDFVSQLSTEVDLEDLTTFYKLHQADLTSVSQILQSSVDLIKVRINWKTKHLDSVVNWLKLNRNQM